MILTFNSKSTGTQQTQFRIMRENMQYLPVNLQHQWRMMYSKYLVPSSTRMPYPSSVIIELANTCNLDCPMCRVGRFGWDASRVMSWDLYKQIIAVLGSRVKRIRLNGLGEATLIPRFHEYVALLDRCTGVTREIITNFTAPIATYQSLLSKRFTVLISWDAASAPMFEMLRRGASFDRSIDKLESLGKWASSSGFQNDMLLLFTMQQANIDELPGVVALAANYHVPDVIVNMERCPGATWTTSQFDRISKSFCTAIEQSHRHRDAQQSDSVPVRLHLPDHVAFKPVKPVLEQYLGNQFSKETIESVVRESSTARCDRPWTEVVFRYNGEVTACNMFNPYKYGDLRLQSFDDIWNGAIARLFRANQNTRFKHPSCRGCYYLKGVYQDK